jgi:ubiquinone/menaquinone biosynthesis C-methylase UbiE
MIGAKFTQGLLDVEKILAALAIRTGQSVLDAGCGNGYMAHHFAAAVGPTGRVIALDLDQTFIAALRGETADTVIEAIQGDITRETSLATASMDLVYLSTVLHIFSSDQLKGFILEVQRLLRPNGTLAIVEIEKRDTPFGPPLARRHTPEELKARFPLRPGKTVSVGDHFYLQLFKTTDG